MATYDSTLQSVRCCTCPVAFNRCNTDECPCFTNKRLCNINCETYRLSSNCLNKAICRCSCQVPGAKIVKKSSSLRRQRSRSEKGRGQYDKAHSPGPGGHRDLAASISCICADNSCDCFRYSEPCSAACQCREQCSLVKDSIMTQIYSPARKKEHTTLGCKCGSGKKSCAKSGKCPCRQSLNHCTMACKCQSDCTNNKFRIISKQIKQTFLNPEEGSGQMGLILRLLGENNYCYQAEFLGSGDTKPKIHAPEYMYESLMGSISLFRSLPINHIQVLLSRSPCFHQDCEPKCEVLQTCTDQKACARLFAVAYSQIQKHLGNCHIQMTVKFLTPYVKRGDLYTQQGIMQMIEAGIQVEPMVLNDWGRVLITPGQNFAAGLASQTRNLTGFDSQQDGAITSPAAVINDPALALWAQQGMDTHVRRSQHYINACRCSLGLKAHYWSSPFHDILQTTVLTCALTERRIKAILAKLATTGEHYSSAQSSMSTSICSSMVFTDSHNTPAHSLRRGIQASKSMDACMAHIANQKCDGHEDEVTLRDDNVCTSANVHDVIIHPIDHSKYNRDYGDPIDQVEKVLAGFSGRNLAEAERQEIQDHLHKTLTGLDANLNALFQYLQQRSSTTTV